MEKKLRRDVLVMNVKDVVKRRFMSVSAAFSGLPGNSGVNEGETPIPSKDGLLRIPLMATYEVKSIDSTSCSIRVFQWLDLGGNFPSPVSKFGNKDTLKKFKKRIYARFPMP